MAQSEVYTALQQGVIDAAENSELVYRDFKNYEVAPYYAYTRHIVHPDVVLASTDFLNSMSDGDRAIFDQLIKESTEKEFTLFKEAIEQAKKDTEAAGAQFCYPDTEELRERCMPLLQRIDVYKRQVPPSATSTGFLTAETQCPIFPSWQPRISPHIRLCVVTVPVT